MNNFCYICIIITGKSDFGLPVTEYHEKTKNIIKGSG